MMTGTFRNPFSRLQSSRRFHLSEIVAYDGLRRWLRRIADSRDRVSHDKGQTCFLRVSDEPLEISKSLRSQTSSTYIAIAILARA